VGAVQSFPTGEPAEDVEFDFVADNPGMTLFHCHQQLHMDFGFMALFDYA
jgi:FtsP/CotA-like multicopper oxidase with cupredoxin domain